MQCNAVQCRLVGLAATLQRCNDPCRALAVSAFPAGQKRRLCAALAQFQGHSGEGGLPHALPKQDD
jgi:hypothetical protein